eukprot:s4919_g1.t1
MGLHFVWQVWHLATWAFTLRGRRGTYGAGLGLVTRLVAADAAAWQAWHLVTWTFTLCGRRGTWRHGPSLCVAGVALTALGGAWHLATWTFTLCGRRGTCGTGLGRVTCLVAADAASFRVAGVALGDMDFHFVWQAWHLATWTFTLCGRRGTCGTGLGLVTRLVAADAASFRVAGVALGDMDLHFVWQRGTWRHGLSLCVAGVALTALGWVW